MHKLRVSLLATGFSAGVAEGVAQCLGDEFDRCAPVDSDRYFPAGVTEWQGETLVVEYLKPRPTNCDDLLVARLLGPGDKEEAPAVLPPRNHARMAAQLVAAGFSSKFCKRLSDMVRHPALLDPQLLLPESTGDLRRVLRDFGKGLRGSALMRRTDDEPEEKEELVPGPGAHVHPSLEATLLLVESVEVNSLAGLTGVHHTLRCAVVLPSAQRMAAYVARLGQLREAELHEGQLRLHVAVDDVWDERKAQPRPLSTVFQTKDLVEDLVEDVREFLGNRAWHEGKGVPWVRNYLLHGPPGNGKSSALRAVATELGLPLYYLPLSVNKANDQTLTTLLGEVPPRSMVVVEDIDRVFDHFSANQASGVSLAHLLNCLDGPLSRPGVCVFMTCNNPDRLDPALVRPGRVHSTLEFKDAGQQVAARMFRAFYPECTETEARTFAHRLERGPRLPVAAVQELLVASRGRPSAEACEATVRRSKRKRANSSVL